MKPLELSEPIKFYGGSEILRFDKANWQWYKVAPDDTLSKIDGVTHILRVMDKSLHLVPWGCKVAALKLLRTMPRVIATTPEEGPYTRSLPWHEFETLVMDAKSAHKEKLEDAGDVGHEAHSWIEDSIRNAISFNKGVVSEMTAMAPVDERAVSCGLAAKRWMDAHNVRWLKTETKIYSRQYGYAGTADGTGVADSCDDPTCCKRIYQDEKILADWKSSNQLSTDYLMQTAAYLQAIHEEHPDDDPIKARWIIRLSKDGSATQPVETWYESGDTAEQDFQGYLCCLNLVRSLDAITARMSAAKKLRTFVRREEKKASKPAPANRKRKVADLVPV